MVSNLVADIYAIEVKTYKIKPNVIVVHNPKLSNVEKSKLDVLYFSVAIILSLEIFFLYCILMLEIVLPLKSL